MHIDSRAGLVCPDLNFGPVRSRSECCLDVAIGVKRDDTVDRAGFLSQLYGVIRVLPTPVHISAERVKALEEGPAGQLHWGQLVALHMRNHSAEKRKDDVIPHKQALPSLSRPFHPPMHGLKQSLEPAIAAMRMRGER